ncbi:Transient receptor potential cation channel subfamily A member 1 [Chionoecetes opilio]|uniref:Transient receptor potential cation channel subfamily A member 1 n=1 Tax=Chionoecetes opilio TaxID=41210 RepID=A0A8J5CRV1_CHIOP|nr:Transient receptor potential cation channel subfamily A member 1 [Chionoecetes opilio]
MMFSGGSSRCYMPPSSWVLLTRLLLLVMTSFILLLEGIYLYRIRSEYFRNKRLLRILQVIFTIILLLPLGICEYLHPVLNTWQWHCGLIALLLEWILMIDKLNQLPLLFVFMPITKYFLWTYIKALSYIALLLFVFANIFHLLLSNEPAFRSMPQAMMKMMTWLLGDLNYDDTFVKDDVVHPYMGQPMFGAFIIIMGGFIANLAIRQPSDRVDEFKKCARFFQIAAQSNLFLEIKACFPRVQKLITKYLITNENRKNNFADSMAKRIFKPSIIDEKDESQDTTLESLEEKVHVLINLCMDQKKELKELKQQINLHFKRRPESDPSS